MVYERHFPLGAGYADHLFGVLWDPDHLRDVHLVLGGGGRAARSNDSTEKVSEPGRAPKQEKED